GSGTGTARHQEVSSMISAAVLFCLAQASASPAASPSPTPSPRPTPAGPVVVMDTSAGRIRLGLYEDKAPVTVENFVRYARKGCYDGTVFHRVIPGFMVQGGGMTPDLKEKPTEKPIRNEARNGLRNNRGTVAMARTDDPDSATAQFFINVKDNASLDFGIRGAGYAVFGEVLEGMDVVDKIVSVATTTRGQYQNTPVTPVVINTVRVEGASRPAAKPAGAAPAPGPSATARPTAHPRHPATPRPSASPHSRPRPRSCSPAFWQRWPPAMTRSPTIPGSCPRRRASCTTRSRPVRTRSSGVGACTRRTASSATARAGEATAPRRAATPSAPSRPRTSPCPPCSASSPTARSSGRSPTDGGAAARSSCRRSRPTSRRPRTGGGS